jgi:hypothetical protein
LNFYTAEALKGATKDSADAFLKGFDAEDLNQGSTLTDEMIGRMQDQKNLVLGLNISGLTGGSEAPTAETYKDVDGEDLLTAVTMDDLAKRVYDGISEFLGMIKALVAFINAIFGIELIYDASLDAYIDADYYNTEFGGLPSKKDRNTYVLRTGNAEDAAYSEQIKTAMAGSDYDKASLSDHDQADYITLILEQVARITDLCGDVDADIWTTDEDSSWFENLCAGVVNTVSNLVANSPPAKLVRLLANIGTVIDAIVKLGQYIVDMVGQMLTRLGSLLTDSWIYERLLSTGYLVYNLPNRTNCDSGKSLTGFSYSGIAAPPDDDMTLVNDLPFIGDVTALLDAFRQAVVGGEDKVFKGAELEYIIAGHHSEIGNQAQVFAFLYIMRLIPDAFTVLAFDKEAQAYGKIPYVGPIYIVVAILTEPLIDSIMLVNDLKIPLVRSKAWLTPQGLANAVNKLLSVFMVQSKLTNTQKTEIKEQLTDKAYDVAKNHDPDLTKEAFKEQTNVPRRNDEVGGTMDELLETDYAGHLMLLMLIIGNKDTYTKRLGDLVQMEMTQKYINDGKDANFDLDQSYTYLRVEADVELQIMFPFPSLSTRGPFGTTRILYRGY